MFKYRGAQKEDLLKYRVFFIRNNQSSVDETLESTENQIRFPKIITINLRRKYIISS